jgi:CTP synthase (UTP-ammonia lyase)
VLGIADADSAENNSASKNIIIYPVACAVPDGNSKDRNSNDRHSNDRNRNAPKLSGPIPEIRLRPGSFLQKFYGKDTVTEEFFCNFEINPEFEWAPMEAGFPIVARGPNGEIRAIESPAHRFFVATLFQPQLSSTAKNPHPLIIAFLEAARQWSVKRQEDRVLE